MAHFAKIEDGIVTQVIVVSNDAIKDTNGFESESVGQQFCTSLFGGTWLQTSYNGKVRKNFAGIGFTYDSVRDAFIAPKPSDDATFDEETCRWIVPEEPEQ